MIDDDKTIELINNLKDIPAMPNIIVRVLKLMHSESAGAPELAAVIKCDQALCTKMLSIINSAYYGFGRQITSINMAISLLGLQKTKNIVVTVAMSPLLSFKGAKSLWEHSLLTAVGCEYLAEKYNLMNPDDAFVMGFMHDIGKLVLNLIDAEHYQSFLSSNLPPDARIEDERAKFDTDHSSTGSFLAVRWQLPDIVKDAIRYHHFPLKAKEFHGPTIVNIVNNLVQENFTEDLYDKELAKMINLLVEDIMSDRDEIIRKGNLLIKELS